MRPTFASSRYESYEAAHAKTGSYTNPMCYHYIASVGLNFGSHDIPNSFRVKSWCGVERENDISFDSVMYFPICAECEKLADEYEAKLSEFKERI